MRLFLYLLIRKDPAGSVSISDVIFFNIPIHCKLRGDLPETYTSAKCGNLR